MKKLIGFLCVVMAVVLMAGCGQSQKGNIAEPSKENKDAGKWVVAINATFPPFESIDNATNKYVGIDMDIADYIAKKMGKTLEFKDMQFSALVPTLESGRADIIISGISPKTERTKIVDFTDSYYYPMKAIISKIGAGYKTLDQLKGKKIGASMGTSYVDMAKSVEEATVAELDSTPLVVQEINNGRLDAGIFDATQAAVFVNQDKGLEMHILSSKITREDTFAIALPKNSPDVEKINKILQEMKQDGTLHNILVKYLGEAQTKQYEDMVKTLDIKK